MKKDKLIELAKLMKKGKKVDLPRLMKQILGEEIYREVFSLKRSAEAEELRNEMESELGEHLFKIVETFCRMDLQGFKLAQELFPNFFRVLKTASDEDYEKLIKEFDMFNVKGEEETPSWDFRWYCVVEAIIKDELLKQLDGKPVPEDQIGVEATWRIAESYPELWKLLMANKFRDPGEKWRKVLRIATRGKVDLQTQWEINREKLEPLETYLPELVESSKTKLYIVDNPKTEEEIEKEMEDIYEFAKKYIKNPEDLEEFQKDREVINEFEKKYFENPD